MFGSVIQFCKNWSTQRFVEVANLEGTNLDQQDVSLYLSGKRPMEEVYPNWPKTQKFLRDIQGVVAPSRRGSLTFDEITHVVEEIHEHYGRFHDEVDCQDMKNEPCLQLRGRLSKDRIRMKEWRG